MALEALDTILDANKGGVWFVPGAEARSVQASAKKAGFAYFHVDGKNITKKEQLLNAVAMALHFPKSFGHNWDALEECLVDLDMDSDGFVILYDHIDGLLEAHPDQFGTLVEVLRDAVGSWKEDGMAMAVLLSGAKAPKGVGKLKDPVE
ncbi:MAG: barstar family protein [Usitatibacter sp.]